MAHPPHVISWFEIPALDLSRASAFYATVLGIELESFDAGPVRMAIFPGGSAEVVHGALVQGETYVPSEAGAVLYLNGGDDLSVPLSRVEAAGGTILQGKKSLGEHGFMALFRDTEGNRVAFHSPY